mmetsp:Transcript_16609/g.28293  ORF Transcript_16609/g.28293 Transcript_16609/m.28293 type:complete len:83 (-) Transcript_16609:127-375(-)
MGAKTHTTTNQNIQKITDIHNKEKHLEEHTKNYNLENHTTSKHNGHNINGSTNDLRYTVNHGDSCFGKTCLDFAKMDLMNLG